MKDFRPQTDLPEVKVNPVGENDLEFSEDPCLIVGIPVLIVSVYSHTPCVVKHGPSTAGEIDIC